MFRFVGQCVDNFFAGRWYWRLRLRAAESRLENELECHGDQSIEVRRATEQYSQVRFAFQFGSMAPSWERMAVRKAVASGLRSEDIRLVVLNRGFVQLGGQLRVRRIWLSAVWAWGLAMGPLVQWALMCALTLSLNVGAWQKFMIVVGLTAIYWVVWRGLSLYTTRLVSAGGRLERALRIIPTETESADIFRFSPRGHDRPTQP